MKIPISASKLNRSKKQWRQRFAGHLLLVIWFALPLVNWSQQEKGVAAQAKIVAALESDVYSWSPDGQRLAYATEDGVWVIEAPDFRKPTRLIRKGRGEAHPIHQIAYSPDGKKLAFAGSRPGDGWSTIWVAEADGSRVRDLLPPGAPFVSPGQRAVGISAWLNNREIAFVEHCGTGCVALYKVDVENRAYWGLCTGTLDEGYNWSPTKDRIVVGKHQLGLGLVDARQVERVPANTSSCSPPEEPYRAAIEGCAFEEEKQGPGYHFDDWSPDGKRVLYTGFSCFEAPATESEISLYMWEVDSDRREKLLSNAGWASWSPDGSQIAFILLGKPRYDQSKRIVGTDFVLNKPFRVHVGIMEAATRAVQTLVPLELEPISPRDIAGWSERPWSTHPLWSPDSQQLVIRDHKGDLFLLRADGSSRQRLTRGMKAQATWSPDGKKLALWFIERQTFSGESQGLERFLPPVGKEEASLSDAEIIERYFQLALALGSEALTAYPWFLMEYAEALDTMGKIQAADEQFLKAFEFVLRSGQWPGGLHELDNAYVSFLRRLGREKEATEFSANSTSIQYIQKLRDRLESSKADRPFFSPGSRPQSAEAKTKDNDTKRPERPKSPQHLPSLYIIEAPSSTK
ncbi:MAG: hypothetical protein ABIN58_03940 [candidate division WOR-3 bacterium]